MRSLIVALALASCSPAEAPAVPRAGNEAAADPAPEAPEPPVLTGEWVDLGAFHDAHHPARRVRAWVPSVEPSVPLPALVVVDGQGAETFFGLPDAIVELATRGVIPPWAIVAVDSTASRDEELSRTDARFVDFLADVVLPAARSRLPLRTDRDGTGIVGYSYGGLVAAVAMVRRPETFGRVIAQSPSLWVDGRALLHAFERSDAALPSRLFIDVGTREGDPGELVPYMVRDARHLRDTAVRRGMVFGRDVASLEVVGEVHDMYAPARRMNHALAFALGTRDFSIERPTELHVVRLGDGRGRRAFTIGARFGEVSLTLPRSLATVYAGSEAARRAVRGEIADTSRPLFVSALGLSASTE